MSDRDQTPTYVELDLGDLSAVDVRVACAPYLSVVAAITNAVRPEDVTSVGFRQRIRSALPSYAPQLIGPMVRPGRSLIPDAVVPVTPSRDVTVDEETERLLSTSEEDLLSDLHSVFGETVPADWRLAAASPRTWLERYAAAGQAGWAAIQPLWSRATPLLKQEVERVGVAVVRGAADVMLADLHPGFRFRDGVLRLPDSMPEPFALNGRKLVLVPMLGGQQTVITGFDDPEAVWIAYPIRSAAQGLVTAARDPLRVILGEVRAPLLRRLDRPATMAQLVEDLGYAPSTLTYHCDQLEQAGLLHRERTGRAVTVTRTERGSDLIELMAGRIG